MDHTEALQSNASDRYALNMLSAAEADAFEEHYFDCPTCAEDVRIGMSLLDGGRRLVRESEAAPPEAPNVVPIESHPRRRFLSWMPAAAAAALLVVNGGLMMRTPAPMVATAPAAAAWAGPTLSIETKVRGPEEPSGSTKARQNLALNFQFSPEIESVAVRITDQSGKTVLQNGWPAADLDRGGLTVGFGTLNPGTYNLVVTGKKRGSNEITELDRRQVVVEK